MVTNQPYQHAEGTPPLDDSWWATLLAEEERYLVQRSGQRNGENAGDIREGHTPPGFKNSPVDWEQVEQLFERDETIALMVSGYNRGGLLVEGQGVHGFVPISHLVQVSCEIPEDEREFILADYVGRSLYLKVIECEHARGRIVFS